MEKFLVVVAGPTGVGKTSMAIQLAKALHTEVISADARQVYREMCIGVARPSPAELNAVPHHLIAHRSIHNRYDAALFAEEANTALEEIFNRTSAAVLCGGSGLYIRAMLEGFDQIPDVPQPIHDQTVADYQQYGLSWLQHEVAQADPQWYSQADKENHRRLLRCLEVFRATGKPLSFFQSGNKRSLPYQVIRIALERPRPDLYEMLDQRVDRMLADGLWPEAESLFPMRQLQALRTVGYQEIFDCLEGKTTREDAVRLIKQHTRNYAKRQLTWFRGNGKYTWFSPEDQSGILTWIDGQRTRSTD